MELPQPRPFGSQGRKSTHDFLSLYSPAQQDPSLTPPGGCYLETHDFLQPLERVGNNVGSEGNKAQEPPTTTVEHILPGGIGTYSISHISCLNQSQRMPKPEDLPAQSSGSDKNDENSNCSSYTGSGFSLWEESAVKKGKTGKENIAGNRHVIREGGMKIGGVPWMTSMERPSQSSSAHNHPSSLSSSRPSSAQKNPSFVDMLKSAKSTQEDEDDDEEEEFVIKKEPTSHYKGGVLSVKVDTAHHDQKPNTPRSKHSATEQRRRSKINDRFSMLRELIPHGDQKRDKASFLLEVIDYINFLQEKVNKYEDSWRGWNKEPPTIIPWKNNQRPTSEGGFADEARGASAALVFAPPKLMENKDNVGPNINIPRKGKNLLSDCELKEIGGLRNKASSSPSNVVYSPSTHLQLWQSRSCTTDKLKQQELTIESGTISISTIYSQGLLTSLTTALQSSGVDLSHANISVQIDLGKKPNTNSSTPILKKNEVGSRLASSREEEKSVKRFKSTSRD